MGESLNNRAMREEERSRRALTKSFKNKRDARNHVESIHYPNSFVYTCEYCGKEFNALNTKNVHVTRHHSKKTPTGYLL